MQMIHNNMTLYNKLYYYKLISKCTHHRKNKKPTNVVVDVIERVNLFKQYHLFRLSKIFCFNAVKIHPC